MPIHDWTQVPAGLFHHFHQDWTIEIARALNRDRLPRGVDALVEQRTGPLEADVLAIERQEQLDSDSRLDAGVVTRAGPVTRIVTGGSNELCGSGQPHCRQASSRPNHRSH